MSMLICLTLAIPFSSCKKRDFGSSQKSTGHDDWIVNRLKNNFYKSTKMKPSAKRHDLSPGSHLVCTEYSAKQGDFSKKERVNFRFGKHETVDSMLVNSGDTFDSNFIGYEGYTSLWEGKLPEKHSTWGFGIEETVAFTRVQESDVPLNLFYGERKIATRHGISVAGHYDNAIIGKANEFNNHPAAIAYLACKLVSNEPVEACVSDAKSIESQKAFGTLDCSGLSYKFNTSSMNNLNSAIITSYFETSNFDKIRLKNQDCSCPGATKMLAVLDKEGKCTKLPENESFQYCPRAQQFKNVGPDPLEFIVPE